MWSLFASVPRGPLACIVVCGLFTAAAQQDPKLRIRVIHDLSHGGADNIPKLEPYLNDSSIDVRIEAVKAIDDIGGPRSVDPLLKALSDPDPEVQMRATDGLVNFYLPRYLKTGFTASIRRVGTSIKGHFTDTNDQVIDPYVQVRPDVIAALGKVARGGSSADARANAARAIGILRGKAAIPDLIEAIKSNDDEVMYEALVALQKIRDPNAGPKIAFLLRDLSPKVQSTALETIGLLQDRSTIPRVRDVLDHTKDAKVRRSALTALAMMPDPSTHTLFLTYVRDKDDNMRAAAAEGLARAKNPQDVATLNDLFQGETKTKAKLAYAFALVSLGRRESTVNSPLYYLITQLDSRSFRDVAQAYLTEAARDPETRKAIYPYLQQGNATKDQKIGLARVLAASGDRDAIPYLETLSHDSDGDVAQEGLRALRTIHARLG
jgi:HEAT repeat protein